MHRFIDAGADFRVHPDNYVVGICCLSISDLPEPHDSDVACDEHFSSPYPKNCFQFH